MKKTFSILLFAVLILVLQPAVKAQTGKDAALTALGGTCGALMYNTYLAIGATADGYNAEAYDVETVRALMEEQIGTIATLKDQFKSLINSGFLTNPSDKEYMQEITSTMSLLSTQATALRDYVDGNGTADAFETARQNSWAKIAELLGLE